MRNIITLVLLLASVDAMSWGAPKPKKPETQKPAEAIPETVIISVDDKKDPVPTVIETDVLKNGETVKIQEVPGQDVSKGDFAVRFGATKYPFIEDAAKLGNCLLSRDKFKKEISSHKQFDYTKNKSDKVSKDLFSRTPIVVRTYCKKVTKTLGYRPIGSNEFYVNICKRTSLSADLVNTIWHEGTHVKGYGHGDNSSVGKGNSVPYGTGDMSEKYYSECKKLVGIK